MFSKYEVYTTVQSLYCYKGSDVLKNRLNIKDAKLLKKAEEEITAVKQMELLKNPMNGNFTKTHLLRLHKFIFEDIYPFAGKIRKEQIKKADTVFYPPNLIERELDRLFTKIQRENILKETDETKIFLNLSYIMAELNIIHPFREGNGRVVREFIRLMAKKYGYNLNWGNVERELLLNASVLSVNNYEVLIDVLKKCIL